MNDHSSAGRRDMTRGEAMRSQPMIVEFGDNRLLPQLFGEHDNHLSRIEQKLNVSLAPRGNRLAIIGKPGNQGAARQVLNELYARLDRGEQISTGDVDGVLRLMEGRRENMRKDNHPRAEYPKIGDGNAETPNGSIRTKKRLIMPRSENQGHYIRELMQNELVFGLGPAGTGKTYLAVAIAVDMLLSGRVDRIILSRPAVEAGEKLGFLPGDMREKVDPYLRPLYDALYDMLPPERVAHGLESGEIEVAPLAFMRGRTLANAFVILDEAQNTSPVQMKMLLTRLGENSRMAVTGDLSQIDLPLGVPSGLRDALQILEGVEGISMVRFGESDVVRHPLVTKVVKAYAARDRDLGLDSHDPRGPRDGRGQNGDNGEKNRRR